MESQSTNPASDSAEGAFAHLRRVLASLTAYISARFELIAIEGQEALVHYIKIFVLVGAAITLLMFGYVFLCLGIVLLAASWTGWQVGWISLIMFSLHVLGVLICILVAKSMLGVRQFEMTLEEWRNDQEWLK
jgi:uncharacterized membrane protein YqjE